MRPITHTYALKLEIADKTAVISSDTRYFPPLANFASGADILVQQVMHRAGTERLKAIKPNPMAQMIAGHTFGDDVGRKINRSQGLSIW